MSALGFNEIDMDDPNEFAGGKAKKPVARTINAIPDEHAAERFRGEFVHAVRRGL
jgi:hypothetical protein